MIISLKFYKFVFAIASLEDIYVIQRPGGPYWEKPCPRTRLRPETEGNVFSNMRTDQGRWITFLFISKSYFYKVGETIKKNWKSNVFILHIVSSTCQQMYNKMNCFFKRKLNNNTALLQKTIKRNWKIALSIRNFTLRLLSFTC